MRLSNRVALGAVVLLAAFTDVNAGERPTLGLPIDCELGKTCFVQNWTDLDPGPGVLDAGCGANTFDGHKGLDIRVLSAADVRKGVAVLAAAAGRVTAVRDNMPDQFYEAGNAAFVKDRECGNGVVIDHGAGWITQYCHMREGSVAVRPEDTVAAGARLGDVGYSGEAAFPHVHLALRHDKKVVDPVTGREPDGTCGLAPSAGLFAPAVAADLTYDRGRMIEAGFADGPVTPRQTEARSLAWPAPRRDWPALVFFARSIHLEKGDRQHLVLTGPGGALVDNTSEPVERNKAHYIAYAGKKRPDGGFPPGLYEGRAELIRDGRVIATIAASTDLP